MKSIQFGSALLAFFLFTNGPSFGQSGESTFTPSAAYEIVLVGTALGEFTAPAGTNGQFGFDLSARISFGFIDHKGKNFGLFDIDANFCLRNPESCPIDPCLAPLINVTQSSGLLPYFKCALGTDRSAQISPTPITVNGRTMLENAEAEFLGNVMDATFIASSESAVLYRNSADGGYSVLNTAQFNEVMVGLGYTITDNTNPVDMEFYASHGFCFDVGPCEPIEMLATGRCYHPVTGRFYPCN